MSTTTTDPFARASAAVDFIRTRAALTPTVGIILGSGLGEFAAQIEDAVAIPSAEIPYFPQSTVVGH
jgi:purine-nucleoside phosphorylase